MNKRRSTSTPERFLAGLYSSSFQPRELEYTLLGIDEGVANLNASAPFRAPQTYSSLHGGMAYYQNNYPGVRATDGLQTIRAVESVEYQPIYTHVQSTSVNDADPSHHTWNNLHIQNQPAMGRQSMGPIMTYHPYPTHQNFNSWNPVGVGSVQSNRESIFPQGSYPVPCADIMILPPFAALAPANGSRTTSAKELPQESPAYDEISPPADGKRYRCKCGHETKRLGDMKRHQESRRHSEPKYICVCRKTYTRKDTLARHEVNCAEKELPRNGFW